MRSLVESTQLNCLTNIYPIGAICNLNTFKLIKGLTHYKDLISENEKNKINSFRTILNDGNGFYRVIMFGYLEVHILNKNIPELKKLIFDIHETILNPLRRKNFNINKYELLGILNIIIEYLESERVELAYAFFLKAYFVFDWFDKVKLLK